MRETIKPNDIVLHKPTGIEMEVAGINYDEGFLIPKGELFPGKVRIDHCELTEQRYEFDLQDNATIKRLMELGLSAYVDAKSAIGRGWF